MELARAGRAVYVIGLTADHAYMLRRQALALGLAHSDGIKFECLADMPSFDLTRMQLRGAHPNCVVLVDHWAIEHRYASMIAELRRYDAR